MVTLRSFFNRHTFSEYKSGFLYIFSSKVLLVIIVFLTTPILARIYNPEDYGLFALMNSAVFTISLFSNLSLPVCLLAIDDEKLVKTVSGIVGYAIITNFLLAGFGCIAVLIGRHFGLLHGLIIDVQIVCMVCLSSLLVTITQVLANINIREKTFRNNVIVNLADNISIRLSSLSLGLIGFTKLGLFYAELTGKVVNILTQYYFKKFDGSLLDKKNLFSFANIRSTIVENKDYPIYNLPVSLINTFSNQVVLWMLAFFFSRQSVGYFTMSLGLVNIPLLLFANSFQPLVMRKLIDESKNFPSQFFFSISIKIFLLSFAIYFLLYLFSPAFIQLYLGEKWLNSIPFIQILCIPFAFQLLGNSIGGAFIVFKKQKANFVIKGIFLAILLMALVFQHQVYPDLKSMVIVYAVVVSLEELTKILFLGLSLQNVRRN
ncbi:MAG TPA: oligosaccharide flippase family protein [Ohtaekwangia sp.]|nr:oligosaccharide flippase family protein [Ohtaekwangia sp.]